MARFQLRNPIRDRWKDYLRMQKLLVTLQAVDNDLAKERQGLQQRYEAALAATMAVDVQADGTATASFAGRRGSEGVAERCSRRLAQLETHRAFVEEMQRTVERFMHDNEIDEAAGQ